MNGLLYFKYKSFNSKDKVINKVKNKKSKVIITICFFFGGEL